MIITNLKEFRKEYNHLRNDVLVRYNIQEGQKARLKGAIMLYVSINNSDFIKVTKVKSDMEDYIKTRMEIGTYKYKLEALV